VITVNERLSPQTAYAALRITTPKSVNRTAVRNATSEPHDLLAPRAPCAALCGIRSAHERKTPLTSDTVHSGIRYPSGVVVCAENRKWCTGGQTRGRAPWISERR